MQIIHREKILFFLLLFLLNFNGGTVWSQNPANEVPTYTHIGKEDLSTVKFDLSNLSVNTEDLVIAIATDPDGFVYTLTFGNGVDKRGPDGEMIDDNFITDLDSPTDIAIDDNGFIYIADFEAEGEEYYDNGKIKKYNPIGQLKRTTFTSYYRPLGIDVVDEFLYIAEHNDGKQGPENTPSSRIRKIHLLNGLVAENYNVVLPFRIAANSEGEVFVSQAGENDPSVLVFDSDLNFQTELANIESPGSVVIDDFDYIHVIEYAGRIDFSEFINFEELSPTRISEIAESIDRGIASESFGIKIFSPDLSFEYFFKDQVDFPLDLAFNNCDRMYLNNSEIFGGEFFGFYLPDRLEFDLEIYNRTPSFDVEPPTILSCSYSRTVTALPGEDYAIVDFGDPIVLDNCNYSIEQTQGLPSGSQFPIGVHTIEFTATDGAGLTDNCSFIITVEPSNEEVLPEFGNCPTIDKSADQGKCGATVTFDLPTAHINGKPVEVVKTEGPDSGSFFPVGSTEIVFEAYGSGGTPVQCTITVNVSDDEDPEIFCSDDITVEAFEGENFAIVNFEQPEFGDNCSATISQTNGLPSGSEFSVGEHFIEFTATDLSGNSQSCSFSITVNPYDPEIEISCLETYTLFLDTSGEAVLDPEELYQGNAPGVNFELSEKIFSCADLGKRKVTLSYSGNGISGSCDILITIADKISPEISCLSTQFGQLENGKFELPDYTGQVEFSDNCSADGTLKQKPIPGTIITESTEVTITATDKAGNISEACTFSVEMEAPNVNNPPVAENDLYSTNVNETLVVSAPGVLENDADPETNALSAEIRDLPDHGEITFNADGSFNYQPDQDYVGDDSFSYVAFDGEFYSEVTAVSITITGTDAPNNLPVARNDSYTIGQGELLSVLTPGILANDTDPDGDQLIAELNSGVSNGQLSLRSDGSFEYNPDDDFTGVDSFTYVIYDGTGYSEAATVTINVVAGGTSYFDCVNSYTIYLDSQGNGSIEIEDLYESNEVDPDVSVNRSDFTCLDAGKTIDIRLDYQLNGNQDYCIIPVTVLDTIAPTVITKNITVALGAEGTASISRTDIDNGSFDNCEISGFTLDKWEFDCTDLGENLVTVEVEDVSGNSVSATALVTVVDPGNICGQGPIEPPIEGPYVILYPNPGNGVVFIATSPGIQLDRVQVFDMRGRFLLEKEFPEIMTGDYQVDLRQFQSAVYVLKLFSGDRTYIRRAVIRID